MAESDEHPLQRVWIADGCIICNLCEDTCPEVFDVREDNCHVRDSADQYYRTHAPQIAQAAAECPVEVIKLQRRE